MVSNPHLKSEKTPVEILSRIEKWHHLQEHLSGIVGANLSFLDPSGNYVVPPTRIHAFCSEMAKPLNPFKIPEEDCALKAFHHLLNSNEKTYVCPHDFNFKGCKAYEHDHTVGILIIGPVLIGHRQPEAVTRVQCHDLEIDPEIFCDRIRELKVFSHHGIQMLMDFVTELMECLHLFV